MPLIQVTLIEGRPPDRLQTLIAELTGTVARVLGTPETSVRVILLEVPATHWGVGGVSKASANRTDGSGSGVGAATA